MDIYVCTLDYRLRLWTTSASRAVSAAAELLVIIIIIAIITQLFIQVSLNL